MLILIDWGGISNSNGLPSLLDFGRMVELQQKFKEIVLLCFFIFIGKTVIPIRGSYTSTSTDISSMMPATEQSTQMSVPQFAATPVEQPCTSGFSRFGNWSHGCYKLGSNANAGLAMVSCTTMGAHLAGLTHFKFKQYKIFL